MLLPPFPFLYNTNLHVRAVTTTHEFSKQILHPLRSWSSLFCKSGPATCNIPPSVSTMRCVCFLNCAWYLLFTGKIESQGRCVKFGRKYLPTFSSYTHKSFHVRCFKPYRAKRGFENDVKLTRIISFPRGEKKPYQNSIKLYSLDSRYLRLRFSKNLTTRVRFFLYNNKKGLLLFGFFVRYFRVFFHIEKI